MLRTIVKVIAVLVFLSGLVWFLQGFGILPGTFMFLNPDWITNGAITMVIGGALFWLSNLIRK
jgi:hypothetical protein